MARSILKSLRLGCALVCLIALSGCGETAGLEIPYPKLATVQKIKAKLLSKEEQEAAIQDLSLEQENHRDKAIKNIETR